MVFSVPTWWLWITGGGPLSTNVSEIILPGITAYVLMMFCFKRGLCASTYNQLLMRSLLSFAQVLCQLGSLKVNYKQYKSKIWVIIIGTLCMNEFGAGLGIMIISGELNWGSKTKFFGFFSSRVLFWDWISFQIQQSLHSDKNTAWFEWAGLRLDDSNEAPSTSAKASWRSKGRSRCFCFVLRAS